MNELGVSTEYWAGWFRRRVGGYSEYPVNIGYAAMSALEVYVEEVEGLTTLTAASYAGRGGLWNTVGVSERGLRGCIVVGRRGATILVEGNDCEAEKRFTIAHEVAHYILEVRRHRERAADKMGRDFSDVLYGLKEATPTERIDAWLNDVRSDKILHLMDRAPGGGYGCARTMDAECVADELALEILAPRSDMKKVLSSLGQMGFAESLSAAQRIAERRYGLPGAIAGVYASRAVRRLKGGPSTAERFGFGL